MNHKLSNMRLMIDIIMPISVVLLFLPGSVGQYAPSLMSVVYAVEKVIFLVCAGLYFFRRKMFKNGFLMAGLGYIVWLIIMTYVNGDSLSEIGTYLNYFSISIITIYCMERDPLKFSRVMSWMFTVLLLLNTVFWKDGGMYVNSSGQECFVLGTKTSLTEYQIIACCFIWLYFCLLPKRKKKNAVVLYAVVCVSVIVFYILQPVSTSILCLILFSALMLLQTLGFKVIHVVLKYGFCFMLALNIAIVFFNANTFFANFFTNVLQESTDMNNRTYIWQVVLVQIADSPLFGHGLNSNASFAIGTSGVAAINQATHNHLLYMVYTGGIVGTVYFYLLCAWLLKKAKSDTIAGRIIMITLITFGLLWISEQLKGYLVIMPFLMGASCIDSVVDQCIEGNMKRIVFRSKKVEGITRYEHPYE